MRTRQAVFAAVGLIALCVTGAIALRSRTPEGALGAAQAGIPVPPPPGASASAQAVTPFERIGSPYLRTVDANYNVTISPEAVYSYYAPRLRALGYAASGQGQSCGPGVPCLLDWAFQKGSYDTVVLTVEPRPSGASRYSIELQEIVPPPRPQASVVPRDVTSVTIELLPSGQGQAVTITSPSEIAALRRAVNLLPMDTRGPHGCAVDTGLGAVVTFHAGGAAYTFTEDRACTSVKGPGGTALEDLGSLWNVVVKDAGQTAPPAQ